MSRFRTHWLALFGGATLIALSLSTAMGAKPDAGENRGQQVSAFVHSLGGDVEETDTDTEETDTDTDTDAEDETETEDDTETDTEDETEVEDSESSSHGECVKAVAQDKEAMGGDNENHGGAVSQAARFDCRDEEAAAEDAAAEDAADDSEESAADDTDASTATVEHGKGHAKAHGKGHNKHS